MHHDWFVLVTVEHASNAIPEDLDLGVPTDVLDTHVAWDPGAQEIGSIIAADLSAPLFLGRYTRLVADLNRNPDNPAAVPEVAFGVEIPANVGLSADDRAARIRRFHTPYWDRVAETVDGALAMNPTRCVLHLSIHSFTGEFAGEVRKMSMGVMLDPSRRLERHAADLMLHRLERLACTRSKTSLTRDSATPLPPHYEVDFPKTATPASRSKLVKTISTRSTRSVIGSSRPSSG